MPEIPIDEAKMLDFTTTKQTFELPEMTQTERTAGYDAAQNRADYAARGLTAETVEEVLEEVIGKRQNEYRQEILSGKRLSNGVLPLKRLTSKHKTMILMHLSGKVGMLGIAKEMGCSYSTVNRVLNDPLTKPYIEAFEQGLEMDIRAMRMQAVNVVREGLSSEDKKLALSAVDRYTKLAGIDEDNTAGQHNTNITIINKARVKFLGELKKTAEMAGVIEAEFQDVSL